MKGIMKRFHFWKLKILFVYPKMVKNQVSTLLSLILIVQGSDNILWLILSDKEILIDFYKLGAFTLNPLPGKFEKDSFVFLLN